jgi:hypothetical protein
MARSLITDNYRAALLASLRARPGQTTAELCASVPGKAIANAEYHLRRLLALGKVLARATPDATARRMHRAA